jgi:FAD/FMN-containing dehydrogenase
MPYVLNAVTGWTDAADGDAHTQWARAVVAAAEAVSTGRAYVNFQGDADVSRTAYGTGTYDQLVELKRQYDPTNVFRLNQNIDPGE